MGQKHNKWHLSLHPFVPTTYYNYFQDDFEGISAWWPQLQSSPPPRNKRAPQSRKRWLKPFRAFTTTTRRRVFPHCLPNTRGWAISISLSPSFVGGLCSLEGPRARERNLEQTELAKLWSFKWPMGRECVCCMYVLLGIGRMQKKVFPMFVFCNLYLLLSTQKYVYLPLKAKSLSLRWNSPGVASDLVAAFFDKSEGDYHKMLRECSGDCKENSQVPN